MDRKTRKLREAARRHLKARKYEKAASAYAELRALDPENPRWPHKEGEAFQRMDRRAEAIEAFQVAADRYAEQGFLLKAIALCKLILGLDGEHQQTQQMLAELYADRSGRSRLPSVRGVSAAGSAGVVGAADERASDPSAAQLLPPLELEAEPPPTAEPGTVQAAAADPATAETRAPSRRRKRTVPPGEALEAIQLRDVVPDAQSDAAGGTGAGAVFQIPLDDGDLELAFAQAIELEEPEVEEPESPADRIIAQLPPTPLFSSLDPPTLKMLIERVELQMVCEGEAIIRQGEPGQSLFVLVEGEVAVYREGPPRLEIGRLEEGAFFGEIALLTKRVRTATVEALEDCMVLLISREVINDLVDAHPRVLKLLLRFFRERLIDSLADTAELFAPFAGPDRRALIERFSFIEAEAGVSLLQRGEEVDGLYILLSGQAELERAGGEPREVAVGELLGDAALLSGSDAPYTITTRSKCWLLRMDRQTFHEVILTHPTVLAVISERAASAGSARRSTATISEKR